MQLTETISSPRNGVEEKRQTGSQGKNCGGNERSAGEIPSTSTATTTKARRQVAVKWRQTGTRKPREKETARERTRKLEKEKQGGPDHLFILGTRRQEASLVFLAGGSLRREDKGGGENHQRER